MSEKPLFIYGTLCHAALIRAVMGRVPDHRPAHLRDHEVRWAADGPYPVIRARMGEVADGQLIALSGEDLARLDFYEGVFDYLLRDVTVTTPTGPVEAQAYFPPTEETVAEPWSLDEWVRDWAEVSARAAEEVMLRFGTVPARSLAPLLPFLRGRAWAKQIGATPAPQTLRSEMTTDDVEVTAQHPGYDGFFRLQSFDLRHRRFDGSWSDTVTRERFVAFDAALLLPYDPASDRVMLIEQLRYGPLGRNDPAPWVLEPIAGLIDAGEDPIETARREAVEEAGLHVADIRPMMKAYASPGYSSEFFHCFLGLTDLSESDTGIGGLDSENEDIRSHVIPFEMAMSLIESGEINAMPLAAMLLWLARVREELRASA